MFLGFFAASGTGCLESVHGIMKSEDYQRILGHSVGPRVRKLISDRGHGSDPTHTSKSTQNGLRQGAGEF